jgi:hypothetical protein
MGLVGGEAPHSPSSPAEEDGKVMRSIVKLTDLYKQHKKTKTEI